jgi:hypothetical protein
MSSNNFTGGLSSTWGALGVFPNLVSMDLSQNYLLGGILLTQWGTSGAFPKLQVPSPHHTPTQARQTLPAAHVGQTEDCLLVTLLLTTDTEAVLIARRHAEDDHA